MIYHFEGQAWVITYQFVKNDFVIWLTPAEGDGQAIALEQLPGEDQAIVHAIVLDHAAELATDYLVEGVG